MAAFGLLLLRAEALAALAQLLVGHRGDQRGDGVRRAAPDLRLPPGTAGRDGGAAQPDQRRRDVVAGAEPEDDGERERGRGDREVRGVARVEEARAREHHAGRPRLARGPGLGEHGADPRRLRAGVDRREPALAGPGHRADGLVVMRDLERPVVQVLGGAGLVDLRLVEGRQAGRDERREDGRPGAARDGREDVEDRRERRAGAARPDAGGRVARGVGEAPRDLVPAVLVDHALGRLDQRERRLGERARDRALA